MLYSFTIDNAFVNLYSAYVNSGTLSLVVSSRFFPVDDHEFAQVCDFYMFGCRFSLHIT